MKTEIQHAVTFLVETLKDKLLGTCNLDFEDTMRTRLTDLLAERYENHWYADKPLKGSAYRCINISVEENSFDVTLRTAAIDAGLTEEIVRGVFLNGLALWVDPDDVSGRLGKGAIFPIYKKIAEKPAAVSNPYQSMQSPQSQLLNSSTPLHRPQQRPRSISPPQTHVSYPETAPPSRPITTTVSRPSKTPPGFRSLDAGQNFYNIQQQQQQQQAQVQNAGQRSDFPSNIQKLWRNPTSHTRTSTGSMSQHSHMNNSSRHPTTYVSSASGNKYNSTTNSDDAVYSFNQYSSYYNPHFHWRKDNQTPSQSEAASANKGAYVPLKSLWQDDESYQRTHWFADSKSNTNKLSVAGNNLSINKVQNYGYGISRQAQEVY